MPNLTHSKPEAPDTGHIHICTAATACPTTVISEDSAEAQRLLDDHLIDAHGVPSPKRGLRRPRRSAGQK